MPPAFARAHALYWAMGPIALAIAQARRGHLPELLRFAAHAMARDHGLVALSAQADVIIPLPDVLRTGASQQQSTDEALSRWLCPSLGLPVVARAWRQLFFRGPSTWIRRAFLCNPAPLPLVSRLGRRAVLGRRVLLVGLAFDERRLAQRAALTLRQAGATAVQLATWAQAP